ncbi:MAG TPA: hypothetical protein VMV05_06450 [bacterium]|nr:hypothetical protein [bacterium]
MESIKKSPLLPRVVWIPLVLGSLFLLRLFFGFYANMEFSDQFQTYLIGLKYYCTGLWPYFGLDVLDNIQLPGAMQGLLIALPLKIWPVPEAPFILLNLLSFSALCLFAWYCSKRLPDFPKWILWGWLFTAPWVMECSTNIYHVSYVLFGAVLFTIGFLETIPALTTNTVPPALANTMMGFAFCWHIQFHMSFPIQLPCLAYSAYSQLNAHPESRMGVFLKGISFFFLGAAASGSTILPTLVHYGTAGLGGTPNTVRFHPSNALEFFTILARYFSLASCEVPRFLGAHTVDRLKFLSAEPWAAPFTVAAFILGILQPVTMLLSGLRQNHPKPDWKALRNLVFSVFLLLYFGFLFAIKLPSAHSYYVFLPLVMLYAFYVFYPWVDRPWFRRVSLVLLVCNLVFHLGLAVYNRPERSLYTYREKIAQAIQAKDYHLMGERRANTLY